MVLLLRALQMKRQDHRKTRGVPWGHSAGHPAVLSQSHLCCVILWASAMCGFSFLKLLRTVRVRCRSLTRRTLCL